MFRNALKTEIGQLRALWLSAWPEDEDYADCFLSSYFSPEDAYAAEENGQLRSMFFSLKGYLFHTEGRSYPASYLYALATDPAYRGRGLGRKLTEYAAAADHRCGIDLVCLYPADPYLRKWYHDSTDARDCFMQRQIDLTFDDIMPSCYGTVRRIPPESYSELRMQLLSGTSHMEIPMNALKLQADFCQISGGGLYRLDMGGKTGICLGDADNDHLILRELLCPDMDVTAVAYCAAREFSCSSVSAFTPAFWHTDLGTVLPTCVVLPKGSVIPDSTACPYWGFLMN